MVVSLLFAIAQVTGNILCMYPVLACDHAVPKEPGLREFRSGEPIRHRPSFL